MTDKNALVFAATNTDEIYTIMADYGTGNDEVLR